MAIEIYIRVLSLKGNIIHEMSIKENETRYFISFSLQTRRKDTCLRMKIALRYGKTACLVNRRKKAREKRRGVGKNEWNWSEKKRNIATRYSRTFIVFVRANGPSFFISRTIFLTSMLALLLSKRSFRDGRSVILATKTNFRSEFSTRIVLSFHCNFVSYPVHRFSME